MLHNWTNVLCPNIHACERNQCRDQSMSLCQNSSRFKLVSFGLFRVDLSCHKPKQLNTKSWVKLATANWKNCEFKFNSNSEGKFSTVRIGQTYSSVRFCTIKLFFLFLCICVFQNFWVKGQGESYVACSEGVGFIQGFTQFHPQHTCVLVRLSEAGFSLISVGLRCFGPLDGSVV